VIGKGGRNTVEVGIFAYKNGCKVPIFAIDIFGDLSSTSSSNIKTTVSAKKNSLPNSSQGNNLIPPQPLVQKCLKITEYQLYIGTEVYTNFGAKRSKDWLSIHE
jgi:hypothetical protein